MDSVTSTTTKPTPSPVLRASLSGKFALTRHEFAVCLCFVVCYVLASYFPLFHALTWRHVLLGDRILATGSLPQVDPALPLSDGFRSVTSSWASDVLLSRIYRLWGLQGMSSTLAIASVTVLALVFAALYYRAGRKRLALAGTAVFLLAHWPRVSVLSPELLGLICFTLLLFLISTGGESEGRRSRRMWIGCPLLFLCWANLDGSVILGVIIMSGLALARFTDSLRQSGSIWSALTDRSVHRSVYLAEIAWLVSLCQPNGLQLWIDVYQNTQASVWWSLGGYSPVILATGVGWAIIGIWCMGAVLLRVSERAITGTDVALTILASVAVLVNRHLAAWSVLALLWVMMPYLVEWLERRSWIGPMIMRPTFVDGEPVPPLAFAWTLLSLLVLWCGFALTPLSNPLLGGKPRAPQRIVAQDAPVALSQFLLQQKSPPAGLVWVPEDYGDWLALTVPGIKVSANSQLHLLTQRQKHDIVRLASAEGNWTKMLDRYGVELLVVDKKHQTRLADAALSQGTEWSVGYEDDQALVFRRRKA